MYSMRMARSLMWAIVLGVVAVPSVGLAEWHSHKIRQLNGTAERVEALCGALAEAAPGQGARAMVRVAHAQLERGKTKKALNWARRAVAADATNPDAWVFIGGAEQEMGNKAAAKAAYTQYLELAPGGKYARDLRAIVENL